MKSVIGRRRSPGSGCRRVLEHAELVALRVAHDREELRDTHVIRARRAQLERSCNQAGRVVGGQVEMPSILGLLRITIAHEIEGDSGSTKRDDVELRVGDDVAAQERPPERRERGGIRAVDHQRRDVRETLGHARTVRAHRSVSTNTVNGSSRSDDDVYVWQRKAPREILSNHPTSWLVSEGTFGQQARNVGWQVRCVR